VTPFGLLPVLEVNEIQVAQSLAIERFVAKRFGLAGHDEVEVALLDSIVDFFEEFRAEVHQWFRVVSGREYSNKVSPQCNKFLILFLPLEINNLFILLLSIYSLIQLEFINSKL
jgi:hypothetical protein